MTTKDKGYFFTNVSNSTWVGDGGAQAAPADFDPDWPHGHMFDGKPARIIARDAKGKYPFIALIDYGDREDVTRARQDGMGYSGAHRLTNAPAPKKRIKGWMNVYYTQTGGVIWPSREGAVQAAPNRFACIYIDVAEGEGIVGHWFNGEFEEDD